MQYELIKLRTEYVGTFDNNLFALPTVVLPGLLLGVETAANGGASLAIHTMKPSN